MLEILRKILDKEKLSTAINTTSKLMKSIYSAKLKISIVRLVSSICLAIAALPNSVYCTTVYKTVWIDMKLRMYKALSIKMSIII